MNHTRCVGTPVEDLCRHINTSHLMVSLATIQRAADTLVAEGPPPYDATDRYLLERVARRMGYTTMGASVAIVRTVAEALNARQEAEA